MTRLRTRLLRLLPAAAVLVVVSTVGGGAWAVYKWLLDQGPDQRKVVQQVTIIAPPPPPPPELEKPPEPEIEEEVELEEDIPEDIPDLADEAPPGEQLGLDAEGGAGGDAFGLIGKKGGRGLLGDNPFGWYAGILRDDITDVLADDQRLRSRRYSVTVDLWIARSGGVERVELLGSTGNREIDRRIETSIAAMRRLSEAPPLEMPQPVRLRITSRI